MNWYKTALTTDLGKKICDKSLDDMDYWKEILEDYPNYNNDVKETPLAVLSVLSAMIDKYKDEMIKVDDGTIEGYDRLKDLICELYGGIHGGLT